jgi:hypothetical protein
MDVDEFNKPHAAGQSQSSLIRPQCAPIQLPDVSAAKFFQKAQSHLRRQALPPIRFENGYLAGPGFGRSEGSVHLEQRYMDFFKSDEIEAG